jgi:hypothetical protein
MSTGFPQIIIKKLEDKYVKAINVDPVGDDGDNDADEERSVIKVYSCTMQCRHLQSG